MQNFVMSIYKKLFIFLSLSFFYSWTYAYNYDIDSIKNSWLIWTNNERNIVWIDNLFMNEKLNSTSLEWSTYSKNRTYIDHKRPWQKSYYDYYKILNWFNSKWLYFKNVNRTTFSESIWRNNYFCKTDDCTEVLRTSVYKTFSMFLREKWKKYAPHYNSMINKNFKNIWVGIVLDEIKKKYYITIHYSTDIY